MLQKSGSFVLDVEEKKEKKVRKEAYAFPQIFFAIQISTN